jgi:spermidine synthase
MLKNTNRTSNFLWLTLFAASGAASLTYQVVWQRVLTQEIGIDSVSVTLIVGIFMLGLGLGGLLGSKLVQQVQNVALTLAVLEVVIGLFGFFSVDLIRDLNRGFLSNIGFWGQLSTNFIFLLVPTLAMGATTPLMVEFYRDDTSRGRSVGTAYAANILGASLGVGLCGFLLIGSLGLLTSTHAVAILDLLVAGLFLWSARQHSRSGGLSGSKSDKGQIPASLFAGAFLIGVATIGYEIVFFRLFTSYFGVTPYVFPMLLFAYLVNMAFGTWLGGWLSERWSLYRVLALGVSSAVIFSLPIMWLQHLLLSFGTAQMDFTFFPTVTSFEQNLGLISIALLLSLVLLLPVAATSILLPSMVVSIRQKLGKGVVFGRLYFVQTIGNTFGALLTGFALYNFFESPLVLAILAVTLFAGGAFVYYSSNDLNYSFFKLAIPSVIVMLGISAFNFNYADSVRYFRTAFDPAKPVWKRDTMHGLTLAYDIYNDGSTYAALAGGRFWITGIPGRKLWTRDVGHIEPVVFGINPNIKKILFIGLGTGAELLSLRDLYPDAQVTVVEINPDLIDAFNDLGFIPIKEGLSRANVHTTDGRRFLQSHKKEQFDYVHVGIHRASTSGAGNLFSQNFLEKIRDHLSPGGVVTFYAYPPVVKAALNVYGDVAVFTKNGSIGIAYATAEKNYILRSGFYERHRTASAKIGSYFEPTSLSKNNARPLQLPADKVEIHKNPIWMPGESVVYSKAALEIILKEIVPTTDDLLVTEYYLNNRTELIAGAHQSNKPTDYRVWPYNDGAIRFPSKI